MIGSITRNKRKAFEKRLLSALLTLCMFFGLLPVFETSASALNDKVFVDQLKTEGFELTGNGAVDIVNAARAMIGQESKVDSRGSWCGSFISCCALAVGQGGKSYHKEDYSAYSDQQSGAIPYTIGNARDEGYSDCFPQSIYNNGGKMVYNRFSGRKGSCTAVKNEGKGNLDDVLMGDIVLLWKNDGFYHCEIATGVDTQKKVVYTIGGNTGDTETGGSGSVIRDKKREYKDIGYVIRPAYKNQPTTAYKSIDIQDGIYAIKGEGSGKWLTSPENEEEQVYIYEGKQPAENQLWKFTRNDDDSYTIVSTSTNLALDVAGGSLNKGTKVQVYSSNNTRAQRWYILRDSNGGLEFISHCSYYALDVEGGDIGNGTKVQQYVRNHTSAQHWEIIIPSTNQIVFDANGGTGSKASVGLENDDALPSLENTFTRSGYKFTGWKVQNPDGKWLKETTEKKWGLFSYRDITIRSWENSEQNATLLPENYSGTLDSFWQYSGNASKPHTYTFYAQWEKDQNAQENLIALHFDLNGGTGSFPDIEGESGFVATIPTKVPVWDGYEFLGWSYKAYNQERIPPSENPDLSQVKVFKPGDKEPITGETTFYAIWKQVKNDYLSQCKKTETYVILEMGSSTDSIMSLPCSSSTNAESKVLRGIKAGDNYTATAIWKNTDNEYWYQIGENEFIFGGSATAVDVPADIIRGNAELAAYVIPQGNPCTIQGSISTKAGTIAGVTGWLYGSQGNVQQPVTVNPGSGSFNFKNSKIDSDLKFGYLPKGVGHFSASVSVRVPIINKGGKTTVNQNFITALDPVYFNIIGYCVIVYDAKGGTGTPDPQEKWDGSTVKVSMNEPTREGYLFEGWCTDSSAAFVSYKPGDTIRDVDCEQEVLTLYAVWQVDRRVFYKITFDANGGTGAPAAEEVQEGWWAGNWNIPDQQPKNGSLAFDGWTIKGDSSGKLYLPGQKPGITKDTCFVAKWRDLTICTLTYDANGGSGAPDWPDFFDVSGGPMDVKITSTVPTREGYTFLGWADSPDATKAQYQSGGWIKGLTGNKTIYAVWQSNSSVKLDFQLQGGTNGPAAMTAEMNTAVTIPDDTPVRDDYIFTGWALEASATTANYQPGDTMTLTQDTTLYAVWTQAVTVSYDLRGGSGEFPDQIVARNSTVTIPSFAPTREGYVFKGWGYTAVANKKERAITVNEPVYQPGDQFTMGWLSMKLLAVWEEEQTVAEASLVFPSLQKAWKIEDGKPTEVDYSSVTTDGLLKVTFMATPSVGANNLLQTGYPQLMFCPTDENKVALELPKSNGKYSLEFFVAEGTYPVEVFGGDNCCSLPASYNLKFEQSGTVNVNLANLYFGGNGGFGPPWLNTQLLCVTEWLGDGLTPFMTRDGYDFAGWASSPTATVAEIPAGTAVPVNADRTLYAVWQEQSTEDATVVVPSIEKAWKIEDGNPTELDYSSVSTEGLRHVTFNVTLSSRVKELLGTNLPKLVFCAPISNDGAVSVDLPLIAGSTNGIECLIADGSYDVALWATLQGTHNHTTLPSAQTLSILTDTTINLNMSCVTFDGNGGNLSLANGMVTPPDNTFVYVNEWSESTVSGITATREGYDFLGWSRSSSAETVDYDSHDMIPTTEDLVLYAVWKEYDDTNYHYVVDVLGNKTWCYSLDEGCWSARETYDVSSLNHMIINLDLTDGARNLVEDGTYHFVLKGTKVGIFCPVAVQNNVIEVYLSDDSYTLGCSLGGTVLVPKGGQESAPIFQVPGNEFFTAHFFRVTFHPNGGTIQDYYGGGRTADASGNMAILTCAEDSESHIYATRDAYIFEGWSKDSNATEAEYSQSVSFEGFSEDTVLYAVWRSDESVTPASEGKTKLAAPKSVTVPVENADSDKNTEKTEETTVSETQEPYVLTYDTGGRTDAPEMQTANEQNVVIVTDKLPACEGFTFLGWATLEEPDTVAFIAGDELTLTDNLTLFAVWQENRADVPESGSETPKKAEEEVIKEQNPEKTEEAEIKNSVEAENPSDPEKPEELEKAADPSPEPQKEEPKEAEPPVEEPEESGSGDEEQS